MKILTNEEYNSFAINQLHALGHWPRVLRMYKNCIKWYPDKAKNLSLTEFAIRFYEYLVLSHFV